MLGVGASRLTELLSLTTTVYYSLLHRHLLHLRAQTYFCAPRRASGRVVVGEDEMGMVRLSCSTIASVALVVRLMVRRGSGIRYNTSGANLDTNVSVTFPKSGKYVHLLVPMSYDTVDIPLKY